MRRYRNESPRHILKEVEDKLAAVQDYLSETDFVKARARAEEAHGILQQLEHQLYLLAKRQVAAESSSTGE